MRKLKRENVDISKSHKKDDELRVDGSAKNNSENRTAGNGKTGRGSTTTGYITGKKSEGEASEGEVRVAGIGMPLVTSGDISLIFVAILLPK